MIIYALCTKIKIDDRCVLWWKAPWEFKNHHLAEAQDLLMQGVQQRVPHGQGSSLMRLFVFYNWGDPMQIYTHIIHIYNIRA